jgi:hypothetical protein
MSDYDQQRVSIGTPQPTNIITLTQEKNINREREKRNRERTKK